MQQAPLALHQCCAFQQAAWSIMPLTLPGHIDAGAAVSSAILGLGQRVSQGLEERGGASGLAIGPAFREETGTRQQKAARWTAAAWCSERVQHAADTWRTHGRSKLRVAQDLAIGGGLGSGAASGALRLQLGLGGAALAGQVNLGGGLGALGLQHAAGGMQQ